MKITLKNLHEATAQQVFNQVAEHLLTQMDVSRCGEHIASVCLYRGIEGLKCAAGCLIADDEYDPKMECVIWLQLIEKFNITKNHRDLIMKLQEIHDGLLPVKWKDELKKLSKKFNFEWKYESL